VVRVDKHSYGGGIKKAPHQGEQKIQPQGFEVPFQLHKEDFLSKKIPGIGCYVGDEVYSVRA
jgi:hypothetical protein